MDDSQHAAITGLTGTDVLIVSTLPRETLVTRFDCFLELWMQFFSNYKSIWILTKTHASHQKNIDWANLVANKCNEQKKWDMLKMLRTSIAWKVVRIHNSQFTTELTHPLTRNKEIWSKTKSQAPNTGVRTWGWHFILSIKKDSSRKSPAYQNYRKCLF